jgi:2-iminobutanoate/2-iminopropanoate deaminase
MKRIETKNAPAPIGPYSQAVISGNTLYISGQVAINPETGKMEQADLQSETHRVMKNLKGILESQGLDFSNLIKCSIFLLDMDAFGQVNEVYGSFFTDQYPARETVEVSKLPAGANVEISAIAELA